MGAHHKGNKQNVKNVSWEIQASSRINKPGAYTTNDMDRFQGAGLEKRRKQSRYPVSQQRSPSLRGWPGHTRLEAPASSALREGVVYPILQVSIKPRNLRNLPKVTQQAGGRGRT